jgi:hypothetical protein
MPEGSSTSLTVLDAIHPKLSEALIASAVDEPSKAYFDSLRGRGTHDPLMAGFKFIRPDEAGEPDTPSEEPAEPDPVFFWFFFPLARNRVAWEATTGSGCATYFFRAEPTVAQAVASLTRGLAQVNFRREPVYLPDDSLDQQPRFHRYAIAARKLPDLRTLRSAFLGRAIHSSPENWLSQVESLLGAREL